MTHRTLHMGQRLIGPGQPTWIVAELSANHAQDLERARQLVSAAAACGADAVKVQTYTPETMTLDCSTPPFLIDGGTQWDGMTLHELYQQAHMPWAWHAELQSLATDLGLVFFSTPFDESAVELLESLNVPAYKIASFELVDDELLRIVAATGRPVILSTGMATHAEIEHAVAVLRQNGTTELALLKCTSAYPASDDQMNLATIPDLATSFDCISGLSDHTLNHTAAVTSVALGGSIIEKHLTQSRKEPGPDAAFSLEPSEFAEMVRQVRAVERCLGKVHYGAGTAESSSLRFRRSLFAVTDIQKGDRFSHDNVRSIRPGMGLPPSKLNEISGRTATQDLSRGTPLQWKHVA